MKDHPDQFENSLVHSALNNGFILPDDAYVKILKVHNSLVGHAGLDKCLDRQTSKLKRTMEVYEGTCETLYSRP